MCSFFSQQGRENLNLLQLLESQITSQQRLNIRLKRPNSQSNRCITFFKESDSSLRANYFFKQAKSQVKQTELAKHTWQVSGYQLDSGDHADKHVTFYMDQSNGTALLKKRTLP